MTFRYDVMSHQISPGGVVRWLGHSGAARGQPLTTTVPVAMAGWVMVDLHGGNFHQFLFPSGSNEFSVGTRH